MGEQVVLPLKAAWISNAVEFDSKLCIRDANSRLIATLHFNSHVVGEYPHVGEGFSEEAWQIAHLFCAAPEQQGEIDRLRKALEAAPCIHTTITTERGLAGVGSLYLQWYRDHNIGDYLPERPTQEVY